MLLSAVLLKLQLEVNASRLQPLQMTESFSEYPYLQSFISPTISASTAIIMDADSHVILFQKNAGLESSMASTTKMMTALTALDDFRPSDVITIKRDFVEGSGLHLFFGERFTLHDLLYALFLPSANDVAMAIADNYPGGETSFVQAMNEKAAYLHLTHTVYQDPAGLEDNGDFTTVKDLATLGAILLRQPLLHQIFGTKYDYITTTDGRNGYQLVNLNKLLGYDGIIGIKTGTTEGAGQVLVTAKQDGIHTYIIIVMDSMNRYDDTLALLHVIDNNVSYSTAEELATQLVTK